MTTFVRICLAGFAGCGAALSAAAAPPRCVVLFIGDGMGAEHVRAARAFKGAPLSFESFPCLGTVTTFSANSPIPDSAAAATAMATGRKVNNGVLSVALPGDGGELETVLEVFKKRGRATGLVTTTTLTHATPAAFAAHAANRGSTAEVASDFLGQTRPDVLFGGGGSGLAWSNTTAAGYTALTNRDALLALGPAAAGPLAGLFGESHLPYEYDGLGTLPHLEDMTASALRILARDADGFFLMVEGGRIDHAAHANDLVRDLYEMLEFDRAVASAVAWAGARTDTLILVTADHETGGLAVLADLGAGVLPAVSWGTTGHTGVPVPVYAWGADADQAAALADNTALHELLASPPPRCQAFVWRPGTGVRTAWTARSGTVYGIEFTDDPGTAIWSPLGTVTAAAPPLVIDDVGAAAMSQRCYRLRVVE